MPQSRNRLENRESKDDEVFRRMWKTIEASLGEVRLGKTKGGGDQRRSRAKVEGTREKEVKRKKDGGSKKSDRRMGDLEQERGSSKVRRGSKETGARKVP